MAQVVLAQSQEIQQVIRSFAASAGDGLALQQFEILLRAALFGSGRQMFAQALQQAVDRADQAYQPKAGLHFKGRMKIMVQSIFGLCEIFRDYYYSPGENKGHAPADAALGWEGCYTPALFRLMCLESADQSSFQKAEEHLKETGGIEVSTRQLQRAIQRIGPSAQQWQELERAPERCEAQIMYVSGDATGVPMRRAELAGRKGKQPDGTAKTRQAYLGCVFTQHKRDEQGCPIRDHDSTFLFEHFRLGRGSRSAFAPRSAAARQRHRPKDYFAL